MPRRTKQTCLTSGCKTTSNSKSRSLSYMLLQNKNLSFTSNLKPARNSPTKAPITKGEVDCRETSCLQRRNGRAGKKKRDLEKELPTEKVDLLCKRLREQGLWQYDEDWPQDEEDIPYYVFSLGQSSQTLQRRVLNVIERNR